MIERLNRVARALRFLSLPSLVLALSCGGAFVFLVLSYNTGGGDRFLVPSFVGLLWGLSAYFFVATFRAVPEQAGGELSRLERLKRGLHRAWYWLVGAVFLGTTVGLLLVTFQMLTIWWRDYGS